MIAEGWPSLAALAAPLTDALVRDAAALRLGVDRLPDGTTIVDAGIRHCGGIEAGRRIAELCMGGLGQVTIASSARFPRWPVQIAVHSANPVLACLGSQYAGWSLSHDSYFALGSGPGRALAAGETLFHDLGYRDEADTAVLVLEVAEPPPGALIKKITEECRITPEGLTVVLTPTQSLAGSTQVVARVLEVALHKVHALGFPLERVRDGAASAPLAPPAPDFITAMGRTNDAILYGGEVHLFVSGPESDAHALAEHLPSAASRDYGKPFAETFKLYNGDFYAIDAMLFSPARVVITALDTGQSFHAGTFDTTLIDQSFGDV